MMGLISFSFALFVCITLLIYYVCPKKYQWVVLFISSYIYYIFICNKYIVYMMITTLSTWLGGIKIDRLYQFQKITMKEHKAEWSRSERKDFKESILKRCRRIMVGILLLNFGILAFLKYSGFALGIVQSLINIIGGKVIFPDLGFLLPLGISFYTFQTMGYIIDVYQEKVDAEHNLARFALFVSFFPQIIQGPIAMYEDLAHQLYEEHDFSFYHLKNGFALLLWGCFKKLVIADRAVKFIDYIMGDSSQFSGTFILLAALAYALQLYADFSGGIDIVRGIAEFFGIEMAENFRRPYFSASLTEYWHRWHMTLGNWVRTYVFYPLSISPTFLKMGKKISKKCGRHYGKVVPTCLASLITFLIIGIWHGANGKYVAFGIWNGGVIMIMEIIAPVYERLLMRMHVKREGKVYRHFCIFATFLLVLVGYYFDIAQNFMDAMTCMVRSVADFHMTDLLRFDLITACGLSLHDFMAIAVGAVILFFVSVIQERSGKHIRDWIWQKHWIIQGMILEAAILFVVIFGYYGPNVDPAVFVYMQF